METTEQDFLEDGPAGQPPGSSTIMVLVLITLASLVFSYLAAFALGDALISVGLLPAPPAGEDPRFRNMATGFLALMILFAGMAGMARLLSWRHLRKIDAMVETAE